MNVSIGLRSDAGLRENNEDAAVAMQPEHIAAEAVVIVADGMGGRAMGERASRLAVNVVKNNLEKLLVADGAKLPAYEEVLATAIRRANARVYEAASETPDSKGMGTTCVAAIIASDKAYIAHVGDSRAYLLRDGMLRRLTEDHSFIQDQVRSGNLSDHDARTSQFRHVITRAIGIEATIKPEIKTHPIKEGDFLLICTDGLSNVVDEAGMIQIITRTPRIQDACDHLVDAAKMGGSKDNITGALICIGGPGESGPIPPMEDLENAPTSRKADLATPKATPGHGTKPRHRDGSIGTATTFDEEPTGLFINAAQAGAGANKRSVAQLPIVVAALLSIFVAAIVGYEIGLRAAKPPAAAPPPAIVAPIPVAAPLAAVPVAYAAPQLLLADHVLPSMMSVNDEGVVIVNEDTKHVMVINTIGQIHSLAKLTHTSFVSSAPGHAMAVGPDGRIYVVDAEANDIIRYDSNGQFERTIAQGLLTNPQNIAITRDNAIYVIDDNHLKVIRGVAATATHVPAKGASPV